MRSRQPPHPPTDEALDARAMAAAKADLRARLRFRRAAHVTTMRPVDRLLAFRTLPAPLAGLLAGCGTIALYQPVGDEPDLSRVVPLFRATGARIALPFSEAKADAPAFRLWAADAPLETGAFGTLQPAPGAPVLVPDAILCPLVGFDRQGGRLGQGGGWYDRAIGAIAAAKAPLVIGVAWAVQEIDAVPREPHDQPLDAIWTEEALVMIDHTAPTTARSGLDGPTGDA